VLKRIAVTVAVIAVVMVAVFFALRRGYVYEVPGEEIQSRMEARFPVRKCVLVVCVELSEPFVQLRDGRSRIEFGSNTRMEIAFNSKRYDGSARFSGELSYVRSSGAFHLRDSRLESLRVSGIKDKYKQDVDQLAALLVADYLKENAIFSFEDSVLEPVSRWLELKEVDVRDGALRIRLGLAS